MRDEQNPNLAVLELVVERLGSLTEDLVFKGRRCAKTAKSQAMC